MAEDWRDNLVKRYPQFFERGGFPSVGDGWRDLLERALARFARAVAGDEAAQVRIEEIKQKYGTLRLYYTTKSVSPIAADAIEEAADLAEARSECTCETCGAQGTLYRRGDWYLTRCGRHAEGDQVHVRPGWEFLHIAQTVVNGRLSVKSCRRYDRDADRFVDAPLPVDFEEDE